MESRTIFFISPIGKKGSAIYQKHYAVYTQFVRPVINSLDSSFEVVRADQIARPGSFIKDIIQYLKNAYIIIANLTDLNPNVFYELGVRHALSNRTIMITENIDSIPSDLKQYRAIEYYYAPEGIEAFHKQLSQCIEEIISNPNKPDNPVQDVLSKEFGSTLSGISVYPTKSSLPTLAKELASQPILRLRMFGKQLDHFFRDGYAHFSDALKKAPRFCIEFMIPGCKGLEEEVNEFKTQLHFFTRARLRDRFSLQETQKFYDNVLELFHDMKQRIKKDVDGVDERIALYVTPSLPLISMTFFDMQEPFKEQSYVRVKPMLPTKAGNYNIPEIDIYRKFISMYDPYDSAWNELKRLAKEVKINDSW